MWILNETNRTWRRSTGHVVAYNARQNWWSALTPDGKLMRFTLLGERLAPVVHRTAQDMMQVVDNELDIVLPASSASSGCAREAAVSSHNTKLQ
jgi:hypothetical protein